MTTLVNSFNSPFSLKTRLYLVVEDHPSLDIKKIYEKKALGRVL